MAKLADALHLKWSSVRSLSSNLSRGTSIVKGLTVEFLKDVDGNETNVVDSDWLRAEVSTYPAMHGCQVVKNGWYHVNEKNVPCPYGHCSIQICLDCGKVGGGVGPLGCPCDLTPGWKSKWYDGMGKPRTPVLPKGRNRDRVTRSIQRHKLPEWTKKWVIGAE